MGGNKGVFCVVNQSTSIYKTTYKCANTSKDFCRHKRGKGKDWTNLCTSYIIDAAWTCSFSCLCLTKVVSLTNAIFLKVLP